jgi:hypothetical protein
MPLYLCDMKPFVLGCFVTWFFMWKYRGYRKVKTYQIEEV